MMTALLQIPEVNNILVAYSEVGMTKVGSISLFDQYRCPLVLVV